jgi:hypothetical protein
MRRIVICLGFLFFLVHANGQTRMATGSFIMAGGSFSDCFKGSADFGAGVNFNRAMLSVNYNTAGFSELRAGAIIGEWFKLVPYISGVNASVAPVGKQQKTNVNGVGGGLLFVLPVSFSRSSVVLSLSGCALQQRLYSYMGLSLKYRLNRVYCE